jgi:hypothetical protein
MQLLIVWLIYDETGRRDDRIDFYRDAPSNSTIRVTFTPGDSAANSVYRFKMTREETRRYLGNLFNAVRMDQDPPQKIQLSPCSSPAIMYHVNDLEDAEETIMGTIDQVLYTEFSSSSDD